MMGCARWVVRPLVSMCPEIIPLGLYQIGIAASGHQRLKVVETRGHNRIGAGAPCQVGDGIFYVGQLCMDQGSGVGMRHDIRVVVQPSISKNALQLTWAFLFLA